MGLTHALCVLWGLTLGVAVGLAQEDAVSGAKAKAQARVAAAEGARTDGDRLRQHADYGTAEARDSNLTSTWQRAEQLLETARKAMVDAEAAPSANAYRDAGILANGSRRAFEDFAKRVRRALRSIEAERAPPPPPPPPAEPEPSPAAEVPDAEPAINPAEGPASPHDEASTEDMAGNASDSASDDTAAKPPSATPAPPATSTASSIPPSQSQTRPQLPPLTSMAPTLRSAIDAYFRGDDEAVLQTLATPDTLGSGVHKAHALMVRAAARYHLFLLGGERDHAQRSAAVDDVMACRRLVADLSPSRDLFSPRFVDFFSGIQLPEQR